MSVHMTHMHEFLGVHVIANWHSWVWPTCTYVHTYVYCKNRSLIESLALICLAIIILMSLCCCRRDFLVPFEGETPASVFNLLQQVCLEMAKLSHNIHQEASTCKPSQLLYQKFFYNRFMWGECVSICVWCCICVHMRMGGGLCIFVYIFIWKVT